MNTAPARPVLLAFLLSVLAVSTALAQDTLRPRYGIFGGYSLNVHRADFRALPGVPNCCPLFASGSGGGAVAGALVEVPLSAWSLLGLRAGYVGHDARLAEREAVTVIVNGTARDGAFEHSVDATIATIGLEPSWSVRPAGNLLVSVGVRGALFLTQNYAQEERIVDPSNVGTYLDSTGADSRSRVRNANAGALPDAASVLVQGTIGLAWELPLNARGTLLMVPEVSYAYSLTDVVRGLSWKPDGLRAGIALKYSPAPEPPKPVRYDTVVVRDTVKREVPYTSAPGVAMIERTMNDERMEMPDVLIVRTRIVEHYVREIPAPPPMTCAITAVGVNDDGAEAPIAVLRTEEFLSTVAHPLLNYVFFEPGSATIPERYARISAADRDRFHSSELRSGTTLSVYATMLNVIGERMRAHPSAVLTLTGCNMDQAEEKGNLDLSRRRAEAVRDYLVDVWGIDRSRLRTEAVNLPAKRSNPLTPDGQGENRRVEIASNVPEVLDVLLINDTTRTVSPPIVRFAPRITSPLGVATWELTVEQHGAVLRHVDGTGMPPATLDWDIANDPEHIPRYSEPLAVTLTARNPRGEVTTCRMELPTEAVTVRQKRENRVGDYTIDRFNLILFSVGAAVISPANQRIIDLIRNRLTPSSELVIEGFADRSGNPASNQQLSALRAKACAEALGRPNAKTRGVGESRLLYSNETPEGRYYCRTVQILVKTPVR